MYRFLKAAFAFILVCGCLIGASAYAAAVTGMRTFTNQDKTRVVIDLDHRPVYSTALRDNGSVFVVRIKNLTDPKKSPTEVNLAPTSGVRKIERKTEGRDVRYLFTYEGTSEPKIMVLAPQDKNPNYRLVFDFPSTGPVPPKSAAKAGSDPLAGVDYATADLTALEHKLFIAYSTEGSDGLRTMNKEQAQQYGEKIKELRENYQKAHDEARAREEAKALAALTQSGQSAGSAQKSQAEKPQVEETVKDTKAPPQPVQARTVTHPFIIAVDAGHGGKDPGAIGKRGVREKNVTLAIAKALANYINSNSTFKAVLIRSTDKFVDLDARSEIARKKKADLFISIHADSVAKASASARGASVWVLNNDRAKRENGKILKDNKQTKLNGGVGEVLSDSDEQNPYLAAVVLDMSSASTRTEGYLLGTEILNSLGSFTKLRKSKPIPASLAVLKSPDIPSLLIETGYLSNRYEEIQLNQPNYQKQIAYHIYKGIESYYKKYPAKKIESRIDAAKRQNAGKSVTVKKGDSLSLIAKRYGTTVAALKKTNNLKSDTLKPGQVLYLPK